MRGDFDLTAGTVLDIIRAKVADRRSISPEEAAWLFREADDAVLREFYESARRCNTYTMNLCTGPAPVISMTSRSRPKASPP
mgnify:CR=1 FL=1